MKWMTHFDPRPSHAAGAAAAFIRACDTALSEQPPHLILIFASAAVRFMLADLVSTIQAHFGTSVAVVGCTGQGLVADGREHEQTDGVVWMAAHLPDVGVVPFWVSPEEVRSRTPEDWRTTLDLVPEQQPVFIMLSDLFSVDGQALASALDEAFPGCPKVGGIASSGQTPGSNRLICGPQIERTGAAGVALWGDVRMVPLIAQGARPVGPVMEVTEAEGASILGLDGHPVLTVLERLFAGLTQDERAQFQDRPSLGLASGDTATEHLQAHDFVVRTMIGFRRSENALLVGASVKVGDRIQLWLRDATTAHTTLTQQTRRLSLTPSTAAPAGVLLFTGRGRGESLFGTPDHDVSVIRAAFEAPSVAGLVSQRELGPVRGRTREHGGSASVALFYPRGWS